MALDTPSSTPTSPIMTSSALTSMTSGVSATEMSSFRQLVEMWHPHVYATPPKSPTPFSIDDILKRRQPQTMTSASINPSVASEMADSLKKLIPALQQPAGWAHLINNLLLQQQHHHSASVSLNTLHGKKFFPRFVIEITFFLQQPNLLLQGTETGRDSLQSTPPNSSSNNGEDTDEQPQPLNLTKRTDPYDQDFIDASSSHKNGE